MRSVNGRASAVQAYQVVSAADELFAAVDGQALERPDGSWRVHVLGVHMDGGRCWLQVAMRGPRQVRGTVRVSPYDPDALIESLDSWLDRTLDDDDVCTLVH
jgi:hypothetical protein